MKAVDIDMKVVEGMASIGGTNVEIAEYLGVSEAVIRKRCKAELLKARANLRLRLRKAQINKALAGNPTMLIWLGKQMLGQADKQEIAVGDLSTKTDEELAAIAAGRIAR